MGHLKKYNDVIAEADFSKSITTLGGIDTINITAGEDKDFGDPYVELSDKAREKIQIIARKKGIKTEIQVKDDSRKKPIEKEAGKRVNRAVSVEKNRKPNSKGKPAAK